MDIYEDDGARGILDIRKARRELAASATVNIEGVKRAIVAEISAAALLDIAYSLRPIGAEAADALNAQAMRALDREDVEPDEPDPVRELGVGDLVVVRGDDAPGEIIGAGYDQDTKYALVRFFESGDELRVWAHLLELVPDGEPELRGDLDGSVPTGELFDAVETIPGTEHLPPVELETELVDEDEDDDLERDFDTDTSGLAAIADETPAPAVSPLDALAEKAPAKKKGSKK